MNDVWAMDFMSDRLFDEKPHRILTIVDCYTREARATAAQTIIASSANAFRMCYGREFAGWTFYQWAYLNKVELGFSRLEKPTDNANIYAIYSRL